MSSRHRQHAGTVLITGASGGIGTELARAFAAEGFDLVLVARSLDRMPGLAAELEAEHGIETRIVVADLADPEGPADVFHAVTDAGVTIDILVNNAGIGYYARFAETDLEKHLEVVRLNVLAVMALTRMFLGPMLARNRGRILNVASVAAFQPTPTVAVYGATKAFILSLTESLAIELEDTGVTATALCPGFTKTDMLENLAVQAEGLGDKRVVPGLAVLDPAVVAREGVQACLAGRPLHINGPGYQAMALWESWQPRWLIRSMGSALTRILTAGRPY